MKTNKVGDALIAIFKKDGICYSACALDGYMVDAGHEAGISLWSGMNPYPLNMGRVAASYISRDERFQTRLFRAHDSRMRERKLKLYTLKEEFR